MELAKRGTTSILLVRHGETEWNRTGIQQGHLHGELSELGIRQAELVAGYLKEESVDLVYSSDLKRAFHTA